MRIERELMRGAGPVAVLKLLERREMYGYELVEALARRSDGVLAIAGQTCRTIGSLLHDHPGLLNEVRLSQLSHRVAALGGRPACGWT